MITIHPQIIQGRWKYGVALDFHTTSSTPIDYDEAGHMQFDTVRPEVAELLYQLKYRQNQEAARGIIEAAARFLLPHRTKVDLLIPVPPSSMRVVQPVMVLTQGIGSTIGLPVVKCITTTRSAAQLKNVSAPKERQKLITGLYAVDPTHTVGKNVLLFDDLFRSGTTLNAITDVLMQQGRASSVRVLTITRARSNQ